MDENSFIVGLQALMEAYLEEHPTISFENFDDIITLAVEEIAEIHFKEVEADNDD
jgi:hypothetical protein